MSNLSPAINFNLRRVVKIPVNHPASREPVDIRIVMQYSLTVKFPVANDNEA